MRKFIICFSAAFILGAADNSMAQGFGRRQLLNDGWMFKQGDVRYGGKEYMDVSAWKNTDLPHDWTVLQHASPQYASCTGYLPGGIGWYRKDLVIPAGEEGNKVFIHFDGVYNNSEVFVNGKWLGIRPNGYISFTYDLTPFVKWGESNSIAVRVDHSDDADSRWYTGSGIYRNVYLVYSDPVHIDQWGVSYTARESGRNAVLSVATRVKNESASPVRVNITQELFDAEGQLVASGSQGLSAASSGSAIAARELTVRSPKLWSIETPYLYTLETTVSAGGKVVDRTTTRVGIRYLGFDADTGFTLNGRNIKLKGVCIHHDAGVLGAAVPESVWRYRLARLKEMGCNAIRTSHNPQAPELYDLCDEMGFVVMDEAFDEWEYPKKKWITGWNKGVPGFQGSSQYFREWSARDVRDMVLRDRNHPSIIMWSIGNEVDYPNDPYSHPILDSLSIGQQHTKGYLPGQPRAERLGDIARELVAAVRENDASRPVTAALAGAVMSNETAYPGLLDVVGYNYTEDRYETDHLRYPERVLYGSENRHDMAAWRAVTDNDYIFGQFLWTGFDYLGEAGPWPSRGFTTGLIDQAGNLKPNGHFRRGLWAENPVIYIGTRVKAVGRNASNGVNAVWNYPEGTPVEVVCYTNCESAELKLDGRTVGERKPYDPSTGIISWIVEYAPGSLEVVGYNADRTTLTDRIETTGHPERMTAQVIAPRKDDTYQVTIVRLDVTDAEGRLVRLADNEIACELDGNGILLGMESGVTEASGNLRDNRERCLNGSLVVYVKKKDPSAKVTVDFTSPMLESLQLEI